MSTATFQQRQLRVVHPGEFEPANHWYPKVLNAQIHPLVAFFMNLSTERIINRYCHLNPAVDKDYLRDLLSYQPKYLLHAGTDLFHVTDEQGNRRMLVIETNSSPSGQKSMPLVDENQEQGGYSIYIRQVFSRTLKQRRLRIKGGLAVLYDKNPMEAGGYAAAMADIMQEPVYYVPFYQDDPEPPARFNQGILEVKEHSGEWTPIRAAFRYVTQRPWNRIPVNAKTLIFNPIIGCLAGGRNKMMAAKAYDFFQAELDGSGLHIYTPETIWDVSKAEIPLWIKKMGGHAVVKIPYSNAGQGVFTIVNEQELADFMAMDFPYDLFIVQSLIGNAGWSSSSTRGKWYHVGTMPNLKNQIYVADVRMMLGSFEAGLRPLAIYARRAHSALTESLTQGKSSWDMLGTNLSVSRGDGTFDSDSSRLMLMDRKDFNKLGIGIDDLIEGFIQSVLSLIAIDKMATELINQKGRLKQRLFRSMNDDLSLIQEIQFD